MRVLFILLFLAGASANVFAQKNFVPGTIVLTDGSKVNGAINDQYWRHTPSSIEFKSANGNIAVYQPVQLLEFQINGKNIYKSRFVQFDSTSHKDGEITRKMQPSYKIKQVFLKVLVSANTSLLVLETPYRNHFFIDQNNKPEELVNHKFSVVYQQREIIQDNKIYIEQLRTKLKDCSSIKITDKLAYTEKALTDLIVKYNACGNHKSELTTKKEKAIYNYGVSMLVAYDKFRPNYAGAVGYGAGVASSITFPNKVYRFSLYTELIYKKTGDQEATLISRTNGDPYIERIKMQSIELNVIGRERLIKSVPNFFGGVGFSIKGGLADEFSKEFGNSGRPSVHGKKAGLNVGVIFNLGVNVTKKWIVDLRYERAGSPDFSDSDIATNAAGCASLQLSTAFFF